MCSVSRCIHQPLRLPIDQISSRESANVSTAVSQPSSGRALLVFLVSGLIAGGASLAAVVSLQDYYRVPPEMESISPIDERGQARLAVAQAEVETQNLHLTVGLLGAVVASILGVAGGIRDRSIGRAVAGGSLGVVLGCGLGLAAAYLAPEQVRPFVQGLAPGDAPYETRQNVKMFSTMAVHATIWGLIGIAGACAATAPARRAGPVLKSTVGAFVAAVLTMMIYQVLLGNLFEVSRFELILPRDMGPMLLWTIPPAFFIGLAIGRTSAGEPGKPAA